MNYKKELKRLQKRRKQYRPVMDMLMKMHIQADSSDFPEELIDRKEIPIMLELLDIGYLDENALIVKKRFGDIVGLTYTGDYPFTESGDFFFKQSGSAVKRKIINIFSSLLKSKLLSDTWMYRRFSRNLPRKT